MYYYIFKRILWFIPTIFFVTLISFILLKSSPNSTLNSLINTNSSGGGTDIQTQKKYWENKLGLNLPLFYFSVKTISEAENDCSNSVISTSTYKDYFPCFQWNGFNNQYHGWLFGYNSSKGILSGDFGNSLITQQPIVSIIKNRIGWTLFFTITSILLAYIISIPLGIKLVQHPKASSSKRIELSLFLMYSLPSFFVGVLLLMLFANPDCLSIFPSSGIKPIQGYADGATFFSKFFSSLPYVILPLITYTYSSLAFLTKLTSTSLVQQLNFDYIKTAKAKGLDENQIIWKHALKNALIPILTVFTSVFPSIIGGSVIIESVFSIPGMGSEIVNSIVSHDFNLVIAFVTLTAFLTVLSYLVSDILTAFLDPRIKYD